MSASTLARRYHGAASASGPLLFVRRTVGAGFGELVRIRTPAGPERRGQVIDAGEAVSVIQLMEESTGLGPAAVTVELAREQATVPVGAELLGRALSGFGDPLDGLPAPVGAERRPLSGGALNPTRRAPPNDVIETGLSAIDGLNTLVRGQKLPVFAGPGLPALEVALAVVEHARTPGGEPFAVVFAGIGITEREARAFLEGFRVTESRERTVVFLNRAGDPVIERLFAPRAALTAAEFLAFDLGMHVLVVLADITNYCDALREIGAARDEIPGRRGYPGYMYSDLASLFERAGVIAGVGGSLTQLPVLTMPDDDITHPIPDLTGYITEGQVVLARELHRRGIFPPVDVLPSLSRLMNAGIGEGKTRPEHRRWADQLYASYAQGREAREMAAIVGDAGLSEADRRAVAFAERFEQEFVGQGGVARTIDETMRLGWRLLETLPREDLLRIDEQAWAARPEAP